MGWVTPKSLGMSLNSSPYSHFKLYTVWLLFSVFIFLWLWVLLSFNSLTVYINNTKLSYFAGAVCNRPYIVSDFNSKKESNLSCSQWYTLVAAVSCDSCLSRRAFWENKTILVIEKWKTAVPVLTYFYSTRSYCESEI
jgi:hypothetical protein